MKDKEKILFLEKKLEFIENHVNKKLNNLKKSIKYCKIQIELETLNTKYFKFELEKLQKEYDCWNKLNYVFGER